MRKIIGKIALAAGIQAAAMTALLWTNVYNEGVSWAWYSLLIFVAVWFAIFETIAIRNAAKGDAFTDILRAVFAVNDRRRTLAIIRRLGLLFLAVWLPLHLITDWV